MRPFGLVIHGGAGVILRKSEKFPMRFQIDGVNLLNGLNLINFAGLYSGTAVSIERSVNARLQVDF